MGILNVTPDSFFDGGRYLEPDTARERLAQIGRDGAAICDVGAESSRPGATPVPEGEELRRLGPVFEAMRNGVHPPVSIDTTKARVAAAALDAGAVLVNDITAGRGDGSMLAVVAERRAAFCVMHMLGRPETMQSGPRYGDVVSEVVDFLAERAEAALAAGIAGERLLVDPGIGFGKTLAHNLRLLRELYRVVALGFPVVVGVSRKSMFGELLGRAPQDRLGGSIGAAMRAVAEGASVIRAHDVAPTVDALRAWCAIGRAEQGVRSE